MTPERWAQIREIFHAALERPASVREVFLAEACGADQVLRQEVQTLLADQDSPSLESPVGELLGHLSAELMPGHMLAQYRVEAKLGEGGMGAVYRAYDTKLHRQVALKVLPPERLSDPESRQRLLREARAASALNHPNIVTVHEIGSDGLDFIVMELVEGRPLAQAIQGKGLSLERALDYAISIAEALAMAHAAGLVHRDVKPGNIMVTPDGRIKLMDFGLARRVRLAESETASLTVEGGIAGTPFYMSPEQARGLKVDARSDIFSLGVVLYEMIAGRRPFEGDTPSQAMLGILEKPPTPLARYVPEIPEELQRIVGKALEKDPEERYQVVKDLELDLEAPEAEAGSTPTEQGWNHQASLEGRGGLSLLAVAGVAALVIFLLRPPPLTDKIPSFWRISSTPPAMRSLTTRSNRASRRNSNNRRF